MGEGMQFTSIDRPAYFDIQNESLVLCAPPNLIPTNGIWQGENLLHYAIPLFIVQITLLILLTRLLHFLLRPLRQHRIVSEILAGILLSSSVLGSPVLETLTGAVEVQSREKMQKVSQLWLDLFPLASVVILETMANVGLIYTSFLMGVETDFSIIKRAGRKAVIISIASISLSYVFAFTYLFSEYKKEQEELKKNKDPTLLLSKVTIHILCMAATLTVTSCTTIARILTENKLLNTELGTTVMASSIIVDTFSWSVMVMATCTVAVQEYNQREIGFGEEIKSRKTIPVSKFTPLYMASLALLFSLFCYYIIRPYVIERLIRRHQDGDNYSHIHLTGILTGVITSAFVSDSLGFHVMTGPYVFGLIIPNGPLAGALVEKLEDFMCGVFVPLFFVVSGLKTDFNLFATSGAWKTLAPILLGIAVLRGFIILVVSMLLKMRFREALTMGLLLNNKGLLKFVVLNVLLDRKLIDHVTFATGVLTSVWITFMISPLVATIHKSARVFITYKHRTFQRLPKAGVELRIVTCVHIPRQVPGIINLLETSHPSKEHPLGVYAFHLVELAGRSASAMLTAARNNRSFNKGPLTRIQAESEHIFKAFEVFGRKTSGVYLQDQSIVSPYSTMHKDICNLAEEKRATFIILPFHKLQTVDGTMEDSKPEYRKVNQNVLAHAPCSVGILIDRGLSKTKSHHIAMLFFGGPDDREALTYAQRLAGHSGVRLTVFRFLPGDEIEDGTILTYDSELMCEFPASVNAEKKMDIDYIKRFRIKNASNDLVVFTDIVVNGVDETVNAIRWIDNIHDLYIVGRGQNSYSPLTAGLSEWSEFPELGVIGDLLISTDIHAQLSVLVIKQYGPPRRTSKEEDSEE